MNHNTPAATAHLPKDRGDRASAQPPCASQGPTTPDPKRLT